MSEATRISISTGSIVRTILIIILFGVLFSLKNLILVVLTAIIVASAVEPITLWLGQYKIPRVIGAALVYILAVIFMVGVVYFILPKLLQETLMVFDSLYRYIEVLRHQEISTVSYVRPLIEGLSGTLPAREVVQNVISSVSSISNSFLSTATSVFGGVVSFIIIVVVSFYLAVQKGGIESFLHLITPDRDEKYVVELWKRAQIKMGLWMQGQLLLTLIIGLITYIGLLILGVRDALILSILTGLLELIPLFGPIIALVPALALGYIDGGFSLAVMVAILYIVIHQLENHVIYPLVVRKIVGVNPVVVIVALLAGYELGGFLGMLVSVPLAAVGIELLKDIRKGREVIS